MSDKTIAAIAAEIEQKQPAPVQAAEVQEAAAPEAAETLEAITLEELEAIDLPGDLPAEAQPERKEFRIGDDGCADWAIRKIKDEKQEYDRIRELGEQQITLIEEKIAQAKRRFEQNTGFLTSKLAQYFNTVPHKKTKTTEKYRLLSGTLTLKLGSIKATPNDEKLVPWLKANGYAEFIKTEEKAKWGELKEKLKLESVATVAETGEIVEGVTVIKQPDTFVVD